MQTPTYRTFTPNPEITREADALWRQRNAAGVFAVTSRNDLSLEAAIDHVEAQWQRCVHLLPQSEPSVECWQRQALLNTSSWLYHCFMFVFYSEYSLRAPSIARGERPFSEKDKALSHQIRRLYNLTAKVVHQLQQGQGTETVTIAAAEYAELIASWARNTLGQLDDERYTYPERDELALTWSSIHARTKRRIANLWSQSAAQDEAIARRGR